MACRDLDHKHPNTVGEAVAECIQKHMIKRSSDSASNVMSEAVTTQLPGHIKWSLWACKNYESERGSSSSTPPQCSRLFSCPLQTWQMVVVASLDTRCL